MKKVPLHSTRTETFLSWAYTIVCVILWGVLLFASVHLLMYYFHQINGQGMYDQEAMKIGIYIIIGAFLFLFIYPNQVKKIFKVRGA